ncbi:ABC transporter substrate-binding protein [Tissierella sp.]|uniref:ABC transporter substrate-binding protein n=1 Tax=Tissierella sp. TaxID=41274 RepID=UPI00285CD189|nr:ABC transporter substrate-binding protein [Tissierella sp.]MDR7855270.1 ABC transporter substrate-binding protein [Tissierella sp.]
MKRKSIKLLSLLLLLTMILTACGQANDNNKDVVEPKDTEIVEQEVVEEVEKLDFEGRQMNVVTTSEKYVELFDAFAQEVNAKVDFLSMSSGEVISRIEAEGGKPMADLWFGGGIDAFMAAKDSGLLESYVPKEADKVPSQYRDSEGFWISKGLTVVGFLVNEGLLNEKGLEAPTTWAELADPKYKDEIIMANPAISGTNYGAVKGILDMYGEEAGWAFLEKLNANIPFYGKRGKDPEEKTVAGEFAIGIIPADKSSFDAATKNNLTVVYPEDGIPWVPEGVAIFKGGEGEDIAKAFIDFMLRDDNQEKLAELDGKDGAQMIKEGVGGYDLGLPVDKLIDQDISTFGSMRQEILSRWEKLTEGK